MIQVVIPRIIGIASVEDDKTALGQRQGAGRIDLMHPPFGDRQEGRQIAVMVQPDMQLDGTLGGTEVRPGQHRQAHVDDRGIERVEFVFETEAVLRAQSLAARQQRAEQGFIQTVRAAAR